MRRFQSIVATIPVLFFLSCERFKTELKDELSAHPSYTAKKESHPVANKVASSVQVDPAQKGPKERKCCWCVTKLGKENRVMGYSNRATCEDIQEPTDYTECRGVTVLNDICSFLQPVYDSAKIEVVGWQPRDLVVKPDDPRASPTVIPIDASKPVNCNRKESFAKGLNPNSDPRCQIDSCRCFKDESMGWNCRLVAFRKDGRDEQLAQAANPNQGAACTAKVCRELFGAEVNRYCPSLE